MSRHPNPLVAFLKTTANLVALALVFPAALTCWMEERLSPSGEGVFAFWTHVFALLPGHPGLYLRRAFYCLTLRRCFLNSFIGFGVLFSHRQAHVEEEVYVGPYAVVGSARLRTGCLIGTRANLLSGAGQHEQREDGRWTPSDFARFREIEIGEHAWVGEAATVMADVGAGSVVAAGAVVSAPVPPGVVVAGNPARFVRPVRPEPLASDGRSPSGTPVPNRSYVPFIDWLKCLGILAILYGHLAGWAPLAALPPVYSKQFGVAIFLFITGYSLSRETRDRWRVVFNRLFEVYLFGLGLAVVLSVVTFSSQGRLQLSNYAPFLAGANVVLDFFPANPTTWYLGTYFHVLVLWALIGYRIRVSAPVLVASFAAEVILRIVLTNAAGRFVAYMALTNWVTVFLLGCWYGQRRDRPPATIRSSAAGVVGLAVAVAGWSVIAARLPFERTFPFMRLLTDGPIPPVLITSVVVSLLYLSVTWLVFRAVEPFSAPTAVRFVARNTLVIFLGHMPLLYALSPVVNRFSSRSLRSAIFLILCVLGLGLLSELRRLIRPTELRDRLYARWHGQARRKVGNEAVGQ